jgi:hypothetical protein
MDIELDSSLMHIMETYEAIIDHKYSLKDYFIKKIMDSLILNKRQLNKQQLKKWLVELKYYINPYLDHDKIIKCENYDKIMYNINEGSYFLSKKISVCKKEIKLFLLNKEKEIIHTYLNYLFTINKLPCELICLISEFLLDTPIKQSQIGVYRTKNDLLIKVNIKQKGTIFLINKLNYLYQLRSNNSREYDKYYAKYFILDMELRINELIRNKYIEAYQKYLKLEENYYKHKDLPLKFNYWMANIYKTKLYIWDKTYNLAEHLYDYITLLLKM